MICTEWVRDEFTKSQQKKEEEFSKSQQADRHERETKLKTLHETQRHELGELHNKNTKEMRETHEREEAALLETMSHASIEMAQLLCKEREEWEASSKQRKEAKVAEFNKSIEEMIELQSKAAKMQMGIRQQGMEELLTRQEELVKAAPFAEDLSDVIQNHKEAHERSKSHEEKTIDERMAKVREALESAFSDSKSKLELYEAPELTGEDQQALLQQYFKDFNKEGKAEGDV